MATFIIMEVILVHGAARMSERGTGKHAHAVEVVHKIGVDLVVTSLFVQLTTILASTALLSVWHKRVKRHSLLTTNLKFVVAGLYTASALTVARCIFRIVEFFGDAGGPLSIREAYFYVFEAGCMLAVAYTLNICHPGPRFPKDIRVYLATDGTSEVLGPGLANNKRRLGGNGCRGKSCEFWNDTASPEQYANSCNGNAGRC
jgi:hypothetical protein